MGGVKLWVINNVMRLFSFLCYIQQGNDNPLSHLYKLCDKRELRILSDICTDFATGGQ